MWVVVEAQNSARKLVLQLRSTRHHVFTSTHSWGSLIKIDHCPFTIRIDRDISLAIARVLLHFEVNLVLVILGVFVPVLANITAGKRHVWQHSASIFGVGHRGRDPHRATVVQSHPPFYRREKLSKKPKTAAVFSFHSLYNNISVQCAHTTSCQNRHPGGPEFNIFSQKKVSPTRTTGLPAVSWTAFLVFFRFICTPRLVKCLLKICSGRKIF